MSAMQYNDRTPRTRQGREDAAANERGHGGPTKPTEYDLVWSVVQFLREPNARLSGTYGDPRHLSSISFGTEIQRVLLSHLTQTLTFDFVGTISTAKGTHPQDYYAVKFGEDEKDVATIAVPVGDKSFIEMLRKQFRYGSK